MNSNGVIIFPTETAYGIGCNALNDDAIKKIYLIKLRNKNQPLPVIISSLEMANEISHMNSEAEKLMKVFHPGPLIIALPKKKIMPDILNPKGVAFRISSNSIIHQIVKEFKKPIVSTSANITGKQTPYSINEINNQLDLTKIDIIIDSGFLPIKKPSTIIDFQLKPSPQVIREGEITAKEILETLNIKRELWKNHMRFLEK